MRLGTPVRFGTFLLAAVGLLAAGGPAAPEVPGGSPPRVAAPPAGKLYHGVYPGGVTGEEDDISPADVDAYEGAAGKRAAWVIFSHNWYRDRAFPRDTATWIRDRGAVPWIRLMLRSTSDQRRVRREREFRLRRILAGRLDGDLRRWARGARDFGTPLIVEYGTECNGRWFPWNARWNGRRRRRRFGDRKKPDGPERFAAAYRRIVGICHEEGARNITWVFHVNWADGPEKPWNRMEDYYPGGDVVDWVGISAYGPQTPLEDTLDLFRDEMDACLARVRAMAPGKPVVVAEFGVTAGNPLVSPEDWVGRALDDLLAGRWPEVIGFSWWNERWENDRHPEHDTTMRLQDVPALAEVFRGKLAAAAGKLQLDPVFTGP